MSGDSSLARAACSDEAFMATYETKYILGKCG